MSSQKTRLTAAGCREYLLVASYRLVGMALKDTLFRGGLYVFTMVDDGRAAVRTFFYSTRFVHIYIHIYIQNTSAVNSIHLTIDTHRWLQPAA